MTTFFSVYHLKVYSSLLRDFFRRIRDTRYQIFVGINVPSRATEIFPAIWRNCRNRNIQFREAEQFLKLLTCTTPFLFTAPRYFPPHIYSHPIIFRRDFQGRRSRKTRRRYSISDDTHNSYGNVYRLFCVPAQCTQIDVTIIVQADSLFAFSL